MSGSTIAKLAFSALMLISLGFLVQAEEQHISFTQTNGSFILKTGSQSCLLSDDALAYAPYLSPDEKKVAVETQLMSNLQIVRLYVKGKNGCFRKVEPALSTVLWKKAAAKKSFSIDDIEHPAMRFVKWIDNQTLSIGLKGDLDNKRIDEMFIYSLEDSNATL